MEKQENYVTNELLSELDTMLKQDAEEQAMFDDFSEELAASKVGVDAVSSVPKPQTREEYLKERRKYPQNDRFSLEDK